MLLSIILERVDRIGARTIRALSLSTLESEVNQFTSMEYRIDGFPQLMRDLILNINLNIRLPLIVPGCARLLAVPNDEPKPNLIQFLFHPMIKSMFFLEEPQN